MRIRFRVLTTDGANGDEETARARTEEEENVGRFVG